MLRKRRALKWRKLELLCIDHGRKGQVTMFIIRDAIVADVRTEKVVLRWSSFSVRRGKCFEMKTWTEAKSLDGTY